MNRLTTALLLTTLSVPAFAGKPLPGDSAPAFSINSLEGSTLELKQYRGKPVSLVFLDSLCPMPHWPDCEAQLTKLRKIAADDQENQWIGIVKGFYIDENWVKAFAKRWQLSFPLVWDRDNAVFSRYQVFGNPYQIWVDKDGRIASRNEVIRANSD